MQVARGQAQLALSAGAWERIAQGRAIVQHIIDAGQIAYGINTGLGALCNITLPEEQLSQLSRNTLLSHACGVGPLLDDAQTRAIMCAAVAKLQPWQIRDFLRHRAPAARLSESANHAAGAPRKVRWAI
ncbi:Histidine ammonia-lyase [Raoultella planticola]|uniref:Histidine ammonia-lyase n=1 Tax=Raoultella planticola TaxID=575 RepID=A0A485AKS1_RAOPL|nr:Histidine ammonia-lyase [Raoultella planticola]